MARTQSSVNYFNKIAPKTGKSGIKCIKKLKIEGIMGRIVPRSDEEYDGFQNKLTKAAEAKKTQWGLPNEWLTGELLPARATWRTKYDLYKDRATRTEQITFEKNEAREGYEPLVRLLVDMLQSSPLVTDADRKAVDIYIEPHTTQPLPPTTELVGFRTELLSGHRVIINYFQRTDGTKAKPHGVASIELRWSILEEPTENPEDLIHTEISTRTPVTLEFDQTDRGKVIYFVARYVMRNGETGTWNDVAYSVIP
jgi:hypothetical protein